MKLFGTAGIRGVTNRDIDPHKALKLAMAYGTVIRGKIAVARDTRYGAEMIENSVISGLQAVGSQVISLGIVPLPLFARFVADHCDGGIMITGSHTPPQIIGLIMVDSLGRDLYWDKSEEIEKIYKDEDFKLSPWDRINDTLSDDAFENYIRFIEKKAKGIGGYRIVVDPANGAGARIIDRILQILGVEVYCINCERKKIPNRPSEPRKETLEKLRMLSEKFDLGAGTDMDADRVVFSSRGNIICEDVIGAIFAERFAKDKVVTPINSSLLIEKVARKKGFEVIYSRVGPPEIAEMLLKTGASFGYEETGKYIFPPETLWGDSILSIVYILKIMNSEGRDLYQIAHDYPKFHQIKEKLPVRREIKRAVVEKIGEYLEKNIPEEAKRIIRVDGVKLLYEDAWLLIRASGTEDVIRVFSEAKDEKTVSQLAEYGKNLVKKFIFSSSLLRG